LVEAVSFAAEIEREKASQRSRDALSHKATKGYYNTGGIIYGYNNVVIEAANANGDKVRSYTEHKINEEQAEVVRSIFRMCADGHGHVIIARTMNGDNRYAEYNRIYFGCATPPAPRKDTGSWAPSSIRAMLCNVRYTGKIPFGQHRSAYRGGTQVHIKQEKFDLIDAPRLRIVSPQ
jgi:site-specific DNA recombinase